MVVLYRYIDTMRWTNVIFILLLTSCAGDVVHTNDSSQDFGKLQEVFNGEHFDELVMNSTHPHIVDMDTILIVHTPDMRNRLPDYGIRTRGLPPTRYMYILYHDVSSMGRIWYKPAELDDLVTRYDVDEFPVALYFHHGGPRDSPAARWSPADRVTFSEWVWVRSARGVTVTNKYPGSVNMALHNMEDTGPPPDLP